MQYFSADVAHIVVLELKSGGERKGIAASAANFIEAVSQISALFVHFPKG